MTTERLQNDVFNYQRSPHPRGAFVPVSTALKLIFLRQEGQEREAKTSRCVSGVGVKPEPSVMLLCFRERNGPGGGSVSLA